MDLKNVKSKLDKVNRFYDYLSNNEDVVSRIDKEAFLGAIRNLYDACFEEEKPKQETTPKATPTPQPKEEAPVKKKKKKLVFTNNDDSKNTTEQTKPVPEVVKPTEKIEQEPTIQQKNPVVEKTEKTSQSEPKKEAPKQQEESKPEPKKEAPKPEPQKEEKPKEEQPKADSTSFNEDYDALFEVKIATDLSQKLSASPIADLSKALGLNEKFLYINELFGGDVNTFQATMQKLNEFDNMNQARAYLEKELIEQYEWASKKERKSVAKDFIKLVSRRYL